MYSLKKLLDFYFSKSKVEIKNKSVNKDNINNLLFDIQKHNHIDFFSIDINGNDYWVLKSPRQF